MGMRLFFALWPVPPVRDALLAVQAAWRWPATARPTRRERLHVTLLFLGMVPAERFDPLLHAVDRGGVLAHGELALDNCALWHGGLAVLEAGRRCAPLQALHERLKTAAASVGLPTQARRYRPHVTLARQADGAAMPASPPCIAWPIDGFVLVASEGARGYRPVAAWDARGRRAG
ncbi:RNA 2',3'-cyclic phosphodiesterase [Aquabacterium sp. J223]|uniref:RNA 2',3'-cyclic phosphodiesterase n=1 Tax=Aquabacterium sp. J223 TaxID=2898431 RepID=UPI0021AE2FD7|nr:RNA 2',3'-cyclic phosphodiesterase [Aquabacterium sp. J223]UUX93952.1 RNA 2',3'-cyclic phosphodiesterase [Aquabacterium sp. J223]